MSTVDKRIVELGFENKSFEKGVLESQKTLGNLDGTLSQLGSAKGFLPLGGMVDTVNGKFSALGVVATGALLKIGSQVAVLGQQMIQRFALAPLTAGFAEYELKIDSIKTMLAGGRTKEGLPVTLEMVNEELRKLNEYSDQTIYSFADMTQNIGKFTNAGVDLETSVQSIKGIANSAALSGANASEAARAMYNFSQALSTGYIRLIDWKSIENANMATVEFKQQLIDSAVAAGTLEKQADGMYKVIGSNGPAISATKGFNDSLQDQWMTSKVLTETLVKYTDVTTDIGRRATEAATKVRTFKQIMDVTAESIQSGWAAIFESIVGDFDQATELWTGVSNTINTIIANLMDPLIKMLNTWNIVGGRKDILDGLSYAWKALSSVVNSVREAFISVFPPITGMQLVMISKSFSNFMKTIKISEPTLINIKAIFRGLFSIFSLGFKIVSSVFKGLKDGIASIIKLIPKGKDGGILGFLAKIMNIFTRLNASAKTAGIFVAISKAISDGIGWIALTIGAFIKALKDSKGISYIIDTFVNGFKSLKEAMGGLITALKDSKFISTILGNIKRSFDSISTVNTKGLDDSTEKLKKLLESIKKAFGPLMDYIAERSELMRKRLEPVLNFIKDVFGKIRDYVSEKWDLMGFNGIIDIFKGLLGGGILLSLMQFVKNLSGLTRAIGDFGGIKSGFAGLFGGVQRTLLGLQNTLKAYQQNLKAKQLITIASAIAILVASLFILTLLDEKKMLAGIGVITALVVDLTASMILLKKFGGGIKGVGALLVMASAVLILTSALALLKDVDPNAIYALSVVLGELVLASILMGKVKKVSTANFLGMALSLTIIAGAVKIFGNMKIDQLKQGLMAVSILLGEMLVFSLVMGAIGKNAASILAAGISMGIIAIALLELTGVVAILAQFDPTKLAIGLGGLAGIMLVVAAGARALGNPKVLIGAAAMIVMAAAITMFVPAIAMLGALPIKNLAIGIGAIAAIFAVLGLAALVLAPILPVILGLSAAVALLGIGMLAAGSGLMLFGTGLALVAAAGAGAVGVLILAVAGLVSLIPLIFKQVGLGIIALAKTIGEGVPALMEALGQIITAFLELIATKAPEIIETVLTLITNLLSMLNEKIPEFIDLGLNIIIGFLQGIADKIPDLIKSGVAIITAFLEGIGTEIPKVIDAAFQMVIDFINGFADSIRTNTPLILEAVENLATAFLDGLKDYFGITEGESIAENLIQGLVNGVSTGVDLVVTAVTDLGKSVLAAIKAILGIQSPSDETTDMGEFLDQGLINGLANRAKAVADSAKNVGASAVDALRSSMADVSNAIDSEVNLSPVITPVLDLNGVHSGANAINNLLSTGKTYGLAASQIEADTIKVNEANQNGSSNAPVTGQNIHNEFILNGITIRSEADIDKIAEKLYRKQETAMRVRGMKPGYNTF